MKRITILAAILLSAIFASPADAGFLRHRPRVRLLPVVRLVERLDRLGGPISVTIQAGRGGIKIELRRDSAAKKK